MMLLVRTWLRTPIERREWIDIQHFNFRGGDYAKVIHWNLAELKENTIELGKKNCGLWKPTQYGIDFVQGKVKIAARVFLYLNEVIGRDDQSINIQEALGNKFNYEDLMNS